VNYFTMPSLGRSLIVLDRSSPKGGPFGRNMRLDIANVITGPISPVAVNRYHP
jgi:hypothetical protein